LNLILGKPHPDPVVETASLASVEPPEVWYDLTLPEETVMEGKLSALQLEAVTYSVSYLSPTLFWYFLFFLIKFKMESLKKSMEHLVLLSSFFYPDFALKASGNILGAQEL
jgi:hypothetical protein